MNANSREGRKSPARLASRALQAWTRWEVMAVGAGVAVLAALILPQLARTKTGIEGVACRNNLKNVGLAHQIFALGHGEQFPMSLPIAEGGSRDWLVQDVPQLWRHFLVLSNELSTPRILHCPQDPQRQRAARFTVAPQAPTEPIFAGDSFLSYFLSLEVQPDDPTSVLSGDRNVSLLGFGLGSGRNQLPAQAQPGFSPELHQGFGNWVFGDHHVERVVLPKGQSGSNPTGPVLSSGTHVWILP
jgi:hypothetical protein